MSVVCDEKVWGHWRALCYRKTVKIKTAYDELLLTLGKCSKILNTFLFLFSTKLLVTRAGIHKMLVRIANREDPDQTASDPGLRCLPMPLWQATSVRNFKTFAVLSYFQGSNMSVEQDKLVSHSSPNGRKASL